MKKSFFLIVAFFVLAILSCEKQNHDSSICHGNDVIDGSRTDYGTDPYTIKSAKIIGDCIEIVITESGCNGDTWTAQMISVGELHVGTTVHFGIAFSDKEACRAVVEKAFYFNLKKLRKEDVRQRTIKLMNWNKELTYRW